MPENGPIIPLGGDFYTQLYNGNLCITHSPRVGPTMFVTIPKDIVPFLRNELNKQDPETMSLLLEGCRQKGLKEMDDLQTQTSTPTQCCGVDPFYSKLENNTHPHTLQCPTCKLVAHSEDYPGLLSFWDGMVKRAEKRRKEKQ